MNEIIQERLAQWFAIQHTPAWQAWYAMWGKALQ